ncbi:MAG: hypothetical protein OQK09_00930 [Colwellia sp.]|nr:hypothetical protein [Colwellia sp.]MCW8864009.1 hypothetical protein [Colwellia sp.]MCW9080052.1 hypothetical protein [Colwellia sp.]
MTLFSHANKIIVEKQPTMSALALMAFVLLFLTSTLVHAEHLTEQSINVEQQECHICHQGIDTPPELPKLQEHAIARYYFNVQDTITADVKCCLFVQPQHRAPPLFQ